MAGLPRLARHSLLYPSALKEVVREYWAHRPMELAAALSYYTLLSLAPLVLMAVALAGLVFERAAVERKLVAEMHDLVGATGAEVTQAVLRSAHNAEQEAWSLGDRSDHPPRRRDYSLRTASEHAQPHLAS